jgi:conjugative relaxase-like TrwC/TraI family protein
MISMNKLASVAAASSYFKQADYYVKGDENRDIQSQFRGDLAKDFGLSGPVDSNVFKTLLSGVSPDGEQLGARRNGTIEHTPGWDLTLSAPKSVSILALVGQDKELLRAHHDAVAQTMNYVEKNLLESRINTANGKGSIPLEKGLFAQFTHTTSRELDPQLHTHSVLVNMGKDALGNLRSIDSRTLYDHSMVVGQVYRNELAQGVKKAGYDIAWDTKTGLFEIVGVDRNLMAAMSKRANEIDRIATEKGVEDAKGRDQIAVNSRKSKQSAMRENVIERWDAEVKNHGLNPEQMSKIAKDGADKSLSAVSPEGIPVLAKDGVFYVSRAIEQLSYYEAAFDKKQIILDALRMSEASLSIKEIDQALKSLEDVGTLKASKNVKGFVTTQEALRQEKYILDVEKDNRNTVAAIGDEKKLSSLLEQFEFTDGQQEGLRFLMKSTDRFVALQGHAGVGKTTMLGPFVGSAKEQGYEVKAVAPTGKAAAVLGESLQVEASTLKSLLMEFKNEERASKGADKGRNDNRIYIVDESSLINTPDMADLVTYVSRHGGRVIFSGDRVQLGGVERGKMFAVMQDKGMSRTINTDIVRQKKGTKLYSAIMDTYKRDFHGAMEKLNDSSVVIADAQKRKEAFVDSFIKASKRTPGHIGVIMDNASRFQATELLRAKLRESGEGLSGKDVAVKNLISANIDGAKQKMAKYYAPGMVVRFLNDYKQLGVEKDQYLKVLRANSRDVTLTDGRREIAWNPAQIAGGRTTGGVSIYQELEAKYAVGDKIRFKDKNQALGVLNGHEGTVTGTRGSTLFIEHENGKTLAIDTSKDRNRHFEHGYFTTAYVSQGMTSQSAQIMLESWRRNLLTDSAFLVGITRPKDSVKLFMDDQLKVTEAIGDRSGLKQSSVEHSELSKNSQGNVLDTFVAQPASTELPRQVDRRRSEMPSL